MKQRRMFVRDSRVKPGNDRFFLVLLILLPLLFTSCLADALNNKFGFKSPETDTQEEFSEAHIYEYYFYDYEAGDRNFVQKTYKQPDIVSISNTTFKPVEEYRNCIIIDRYMSEESYENYDFNGKTYDKVLITKLYYYNPEVLRGNFQTMLNLSILPDLGSDYTWYVKVIDSELMTMEYSDTVPYYGGGRMLNLDLTGCTALDSFGTNVFTAKEWLREISINTTSTGSNTFYNCSNLERVILGPRVSSIMDFAFQSCTSLKEILMSTAIESIGKRAFDGCSYMQSVKLPASLKSIQDYAFNNCSSLTEIYLPQSIETIGQEAFSGIRPNCTIYCQGAENEVRTFINNTDKCQDDTLRNASLNIIWKYDQTQFW